MTWLWLVVTGLAGAVVGVWVTSMATVSSRGDVLARLPRMRLRAHGVGDLPGCYLLDVSFDDLVLMSEWASDDGRMELGTFTGAPVSLFVDTFPTRKVD